MAVLLAFGQYTQIAQTEGYLEPTGNLTGVTTEFSGVVTAIPHVAGTFVQEGEVIARIHHDSGTTDLASIHQQAVADFELQKTSLRDQMHAIDAESQRRQTTHATSMALLTQQAHNLAERKKRKETEMASEEAVGQRIDALLAKGLMSILQQQQQRTVIEATQDQLSEINQGILQNDITMRTLMDADAKADYEAQQQRAALSRQVQDTQSAMTKENALSEVDIVAPRSGFLLAVPVAIGQSVHAGDAIATVGLHDSRLVIRTTIDGKDAPWLRVGQRVAVRLDAYPYSLHGQAWGTLCTLAGAPTFPLRRDASVGLTARFNVTVCVEGKSLPTHSASSPVEGLHAAVVFPGRTYRLYQWLMRPALEAKRRFDILDGANDSTR
ncbi:MAG: HlyD family efflux transporter periplasmic adaptor subunit [Luteibacter sp.]|uniref:HlyD family secretion protein n=1 Tax=Luteibacter sp. TaxID=1886636 RepID=UPI002806EDE8|nr:HlyD family efflux transporter periplasmic adaptor subunit [Luteibacter sp.]MDQ7995216.1 HlyD family efflux transporter periplasmic adaptor subunit [Luteibacter sp.]